MEIEHQDDKHRFVAKLPDGQSVGHIEYEVDAEGRLVATHTLVSTEQRGQGIGGQLVDALADYARANGKRIVPVCPYVVAAFKKYPDKYREVMA